MKGATTLAILLLSAAPAADPRTYITEQLLAGRPEAALLQIERTLMESPDVARQLGLNYLKGRILDRQGRTKEALDAFLSSLSTSPGFSDYARYWLAVENDRLGHPEVAAGLLAKLVAAEAPFPGINDAARLLRRTISNGGDCRLLRDLKDARLVSVAKRELQLARAICAVREGRSAQARSLVLELLREKRGDETAFEAAALAEQRMPLLTDASLAEAVGMTLHEHREFERSSTVLDPLLHPASNQAALPGQGLGHSRVYASIRNSFWMGRYAEAAVEFGRLAEATIDPEKRGDAFYQQARSYELARDWHGAATAYRRAFQAAPGSDWGAAGLLGAMRIEWQRANEEAALELYGRLLTHKKPLDHAARGAIFLAVTDIARGRADRAGAWLADAERLGVGQPELAYWRGRLAEIAGDRAAAVDQYIAALKADSLHPFGVAARQRLAVPTLAPTAHAAGIRLAASGSRDDMLAAWQVLGDEHPRGALALRSVLVRLNQDPLAAPFLRLTPVPVSQWPLWKADLRSADERFLALGLWQEGASAVARHFPTSNPALAFTGILHLETGGEVQKGVALAESLSERIPSYVPPRLLPTTYRQLLYPLPHREILRSRASASGIDVALLASIIREESRFDPAALSNASARGLTQFTQPALRRFAQRIGRPDLQPSDLYRPEVSIALGAAYLGDLVQIFRGSDGAAVAAYNAGEDQVRLWRYYCVSDDPAEFYSKVGFRQTRAYVSKVLSSRAHYRDIYGIVVD